jgi:hypothetical protein
MVERKFCQYSYSQIFKIKSAGGNRTIEKDF